jgi:CubicO group peptidase (beta-lactamase class C family)
MISHRGRVASFAAGAALLSIQFQDASAQRTPPPSPDTLIARARTFELDSKYVPPPGDPLEHQTSGFAKIMCSAVFVTGLDPDFAAENVGYFTAPPEVRRKVGKPVVDRAARAVRITIPNGKTITARYLGRQGCVALPDGKTTVEFTPVDVRPQLPDASTQPWPMGDALPAGAPPGLDPAKVKQAIDAAFEPASEMTAAFVVTWKGRLIGERYGPGITAQTPLESWSMGKSVTATLMGVLLQQGAYQLTQPAPIPEWSGKLDPRAKIRISDLLNMSSGLRIKAPDDPDYDPAGTYPDHLYLYTGRVNSFHYAATRPLQWPPGKVGRYHNSDPVLINYLTRLAVEKRGDDYLSFPQRALFDKIGIRTMVMETDPFGNFLTQGYEFMSGRDWARLGNLYLNDGVWNGTRILPEGFAKFVSTPAPAWVADKRPVYGGFFWINTDARFPVPTDAYYMSGAGEQTTLIVPSHDLVVVRLGHYKGSLAGSTAMNKALALLMEAVPRRSTTTAAGTSGAAGRYEDLTSLFADWRAFQKPRVVDGVPDYTAGAMAAQERELPAFRRRLAAIDPSGWPIDRQVDWHLVRAEMNGLDFDHRVLKPWANNPAFYVTVFPDRSDQPAREGPLAYGAVEVWSYTFPLTPERAETMRTGIRAIPRLLEQAKGNLTGSGRDLWVYGTKSIKQQSADLAALASRVGDGAAALKSDIQRAKDATDAFAAWLDTQAGSKTGPSGVGVDNYNWYLRNVQLVPYTWRDEVTLMERELARAHAFLSLEEQRNAKLPPQTPVASAEEHTRRFNEAVTEYMAFLDAHQILTIRDYLDPALRAQIGRFTPGPREFFTEVDYRDPEVMRTHGYHWFDLARMANEPHPSPIRRGPLLYNIFNTRTEGHATGWEEMMLQAGMFDARPRARELIYVLVGQRAARALGDLRMHANELTLEQAAAFASANTPRGWLRLDANTVRGEQHLYLQQPAYGTSYLIGKMQVEMLLAARRRQLGDGFTMKRFMDEFNAAGLIPASLLRWELTGEMPPDVARMLAGAGSDTGQTPF